MVDAAERGDAVQRVSRAFVNLKVAPAAQKTALLGVQTAADPVGVANALETAAPDIAALDPGAQPAAVAATAGVGSPDAPTTNRLWSIIVIGLVSLLGIALIGLITLLGLGKGVDPIVTAFTALLTGTVGLFVPSPVSGKANS